MHWISILLIAFVSNLDNLGIGISFGIRSIKIPSVSNGIIAVITMMGTYLSMTMGEYISGFISQFAANLLGALIIMIIGLWTIISSRRKKPLEQPSLESKNAILVIRNPSVADVDQNSIISWNESLSLGTALALNNMATGFGAGATGISPLWTMIAAGIFSFIFIGSGSYIGFTIAKTWFGRYSEVIAGILLIFIGIYEVMA